MTTKRCLSVVGEPILVVTVFPVRMNQNRLTGDFLRQPASLRPRFVVLARVWSTPCIMTSLPVSPYPSPPSPQYDVTCKRLSFPIETPKMFIGMKTDELPKAGPHAEYVCFRVTPSTHQQTTLMRIRH